MMAALVLVRCLQIHRADGPVVTNSHFPLAGLQFCLCIVPVVLQVLSHFSQKTDQDIKYLVQI